MVRCGGGHDTVKVDPADVTRGCERVVGIAPRPAGDCALDPATLTAPGCGLVNSDTGVDPDPTGLWGRIDCAAPERYGWSETGGDPHPTATGQAQGDRAFRRLTAVDGDDFFGERCELGRNEHRNGAGGGDGTFALYEEGQRRITFASLRVDDSLPIDVSSWQTVLQMKQAQPAAAGGGGPILEVQLRQGQLWLDSPTTSYWSTPVSGGTWIRIALEVVYSQDPAVGSVQMLVDANADGDAADEGEIGPVIPTATLKRETSGGSSNDGVAPGQSIPSHLRTGVYHDESIDCPSGCALDVDNVQVVG
jgi:hypothetical protein